MATIEKKSLNQPEQTQKFGRAKIESIKMGALNFQRVTAEPGWQWSKDLKPVQKTESCQKDHLLYVISGKLQVRMNDGKEEEFNPGDMGAIPPGHDGWTVGNKPLVWLEIPH
jgi:mannose-6-phosphate isomerase-like protein (cupin superfamily)